MEEQDVLREDLRKFIDEGGRKQNWVASQCGVHSTLINRFLKRREILSDRVVKNLEVIIYH